jgi:Mg-chelatase subunit ChlD
MMSFLIVLTVLLLLWVGIGMILLYLQGRPVGGKEYRRAVEKRVYGRSEKVNVTVKLVPPVNRRQPANDQDILLILDHSGSMGAAPGSPFREAVRAMQNFVRQLPAAYQVGLVVFDHEAQLLGHFGCHLDEVQKLLKTVYSGGGTQLHLALDKGKEALAEGRPGVEKTVILWSDGNSDRKAADKSARELRDHLTKPRMICVGLGAYVDVALLKSVAGEEGNYVHIEKANRLEPLFEWLARVVGGEAAISGVVEERLMAPRPFRLEHTGEWSPLQVMSPPEGKYTQVSWFVSLAPQFLEAVSLNYTLAAECVGWHSVAPAEALVRWKMPEGGSQTRVGAKGPKVLVLPDALTWAWPVLNPLFWLVFGRLIKCDPVTSLWVDKVEETAAEVLSPLPSLPKPLTIPSQTVYVPKLRPALVIGLGTLGEKAVTQLKWQLWDRLVPENMVELLVIQESSVYSRPLVEVNGCVLTASERVILQQDFRPYLENLRQQGVPESRSWIPVVEWLADCRPLTTFGEDRRKARLALLLHPGEVEQRLKTGVARVLRQEGIVLVVAHANEVEGSGMLAEVAHICATYGAGVTAVLVPSKSVPSPATVGMVRELERMLVMRGEEIVSDRGGQSVTAQRLFDRVVMVQGSAKESEEQRVALLLWNLLAYPEVLTYLSPRDEAVCYPLFLTGQILPQRSLWKWVRERTLKELINNQWLGVTIDNRQVNLPVPNPQHVANYVEAFWQNNRLPELLAKSAEVLRQKKNLWLILGELQEMPLGRPYHEQQVYCDQQRRQLANYLVVWCRQIWEAETVRGHHSGLTLVLAAVRQVEEFLEKLIGEANKSTGNPVFGERASFIASLYLDYRVTVSGLRSHLENWLARLVGWQATLRVNPLPQGSVPVCLDLEMQQEVSDRELPFAKKELLEKRYQEWLAQYGQSLLTQLRFEVTATGQRVGVQFRFVDRLLNFSDELAMALREVLDGYQQVVWQWPTEEWVEVVERNFGEASQRLRLGQFSQRAFPQVTQVVNGEDPLVVSVFSVSPMPLATAFRLSPNHAAMAAIYAWPEEAKAVRIAENR